MNDIKGSFSASLAENIKLIENVFEGDGILRKRMVKFAGDKSCCLFYFDGMVDSGLLDDSVVRSLVLARPMSKAIPIAKWVSTEVLFSSELAMAEDIGEAVGAVLNGDTLILLEGSSTAITVNTKGWKTRGIGEPDNEKVLEGPRDGFAESVMTNVALIRRRLQTPDFCAESTKLGRRTNTRVYICYLKSLVNRDTLHELKKRLGRINIDSILDSNYITEQIRDSAGSLFKTVGSTERPDIVSARLLEGRIALVVDNTPVVLTLPYLFSENFQADEDYFINYKLASAGRIMRMLSFFLAVSVPALYIALVTFHFEFLPTAFALTVSVSRSGVPFSTLAECIILTVVFEILRETAIRMPESVGSALSIVGGLVVGQAAVEAKIVSAPMLIVVALSGICGLIVPRLRSAVFFIRFGMILAAGYFGLYGFLFSLLLFFISVLRLKSFGIDSTEALNKPSLQGFKDVFVRASWKRMIKRPPIQNNDIIRLK